MRFIKLERLINLHEGYQKTFDVENHPLLMIHDTSGTHLFLNRCPHQQKPLGQNCFQNNMIQCPWHGLQFDLQGRCLNNHQPFHLQRFQLAYEGPFVGVYVQ